MDQELLPPEEEQPQPEPQKMGLADKARELGKTGYEFGRSVKNREHAINEQDIDNIVNAPGVGGKAREVGKIAKDLPEKTGQAMGRNAERYANLGKKAGSFFTKNKKWFVGGGIGLGVIIPIIAFFFWFMAFKNVHIKNLYVTYRWAQFNRGMNKVLKAQLEYAKANPETAKPTGTADTTVSPTDSPENITKNTNAERFSPDVLDPANAEDMRAAADRATLTSQTIEGPAGTVAEKAGAAYNIKEVTGDGDTPEEKARSKQEKAKTQLEETLRGDESLADPPDPLKSGVDEAKNSDKPRAQALEDGATKALEGRGLTGILSKVSTGVFISTMYCIFSEIWTSGKEQLAKIAVDMAIVNAQAENSIASCQQRGECQIEQVSAAAERYDNDEESFMDTCGAARAQQISNPGCEEIDDRFVVNGIAKEIGGNTGTAITSVDQLLDPPFSVAGMDTDTVCSFLMSVPVQAGITLTEGALIYISGGGWAAVGKGLATGAATIAGTAGGKALIATFISKYTGDAYEALTPHDNGNLTDMGNLAMASASCKVSDCVQVDDEQYAQLDLEYRQERIAANAKRSVLEKFFDTNSPDSVTSRVVLNTPTSPSAIVGRIKNVFASISNPNALVRSLGTSVANHGSQPAYAASNNGATAYGLEEGLFVPPPLMSDSSSFADVVEWGKSADLDGIGNSLDPSCKADSELSATLTTEGGSKCKWNSLSSDQKMYKQYKFLQAATYYNALGYNNQTNIKSGQPAESAPVANTPGPVFMLGDSITQGIISLGEIKDKFAAKNFQPVTNDASISRSFTTPGTSSTLGTNTSALDALALPANVNNIKSAKYVFVGLGTNPDGPTPAGFATNIDQTIDKIKAANSSAKIYWLNIISPKIASKNERNLILADRAAKKGFTIIDATSTNIEFTDQVHPKSTGYKALADLIVQTIASGSGLGPITGDRAALNQRLLSNPRLKLGSYGSAASQRSDIEGGKVTDTLVKAMIAIVEQAQVDLPVNALNSDHKPGTLHGQGKAIDIGYRSNDPAGTTLFNFLFENRAALAIDELIWNPSPTGKCIDGGNVVDCSVFGASTLEAHRSHIHMGVLQ